MKENIIKLFLKKVINNKNTLLSNLMINSIEQQKIIINRKLIINDNICFSKRSR